MKRVDVLDIAHNSKIRFGKKKKKENCFVFIPEPENSICGGLWVVLFPVFALGQSCDSLRPIIGALFLLKGNVFVEPLEKNKPLNYVKTVFYKNDVIITVFLQRLLISRFESGRKHVTCLQDLE